MEGLFKDLAWKCYQHNLRFEYVPVSAGVTVFNEKYELITSGWLDGIPVKELNMMHREVDEYLAGDISDSEVEFEPEEARARMTEYERGHKNAGVKEDEFI